ncbi:MAG: hypothetical protein GVY04_13225 [Cyanobacteria bacterium]|jgi:hypothetical protein|nr:hypothetical protein [Cyanobacteria bacterium GSL.Bin1]
MRLNLRDRARSRPHHKEKPGDYLNALSSNIKGRYSEKEKQARNSTNRANLGTLNLPNQTISLMNDKPFEPIQKASTTTVEAKFTRREN